MSLLQRFIAGRKLTAALLNETGIPVVSATSDITTPYTGQLIFNTTDKLIYRYTGTGWTPYPQQGFGDWTKTSTQNLGTSSNDPVQFQQANTTAVGITKTDTGTTSTGYSTFQVTQPGLWSFNFDARFGGTITGVAKYIMIGDTAAGFYAKTSNWSNTGSFAANLSVSLVRNCALNEQLRAYAYVEGANGQLVREGTTLITRFTATQLR